MSKNYGILASSADPKQLSATVTGIIIGLSAVIIFLAKKAGLPLTDTDVATIAEQAGLVVGLLYTVFGLVRKLVIFINDKISNRIQG